MRALREMSGGLIIAVVSVLLVLGGISLSLAENRPPEQPTPTPLPPSIATSIELATVTPILTNTDTPGVPTETATETVTSTPTLAPSATVAVSVVCNPPTGWIQIIVRASDTLYTIAERYKTTAEILNTSNCLNNVLPVVGAQLYVPPVPTVTVIPCGPPTSWIKAYKVNPGDNLYRVSLLYRTTVSQLQRANCMGSSTIIYVGQMLYVPNVPTSTPGVTVIPTLIPPTSTLAPSDTPVPPSATTAPTDTNIPPTIAPSNTPVPSETPITPSS